jgi:hypothetical protein
MPFATFWGYFQSLKTTCSLKIKMQSLSGALDIFWLILCAQRRGGKGNPLPTTEKYDLKLGLKHSKQKILVNSLRGESIREKYGLRWGTANPNALPPPLMPSVS